MSDFNKKFTKQGTNNGFICQNCGFEVLPLVNGSVRNHCPNCLYSLHLDIFPGDRACDCKGIMRPISVEQTKKGWIIVHQCQKCKFIGKNKAALNDPNQADNWELIINLSLNL